MDTDIIREFDLDSLEIMIFIGDISDIADVDITDNPDFYQKISTCRGIIDMCSGMKSQ